MNVLIKNSRRLLFKSEKRGDIQWEKTDTVFIENKKVVSLDNASGDQEAVPETVLIDAAGALLFPGIIDLNVTLPEPGYTSKGSIESEMRAAAAGGVTTLCSTPETDPINDSPAVTQLIIDKAALVKGPKVLPLGALTQSLAGESLAEYAALKEAGCVALSNVYHPLKNLSITKRCFEYAKTHEMTVFVNPIEPSLHKGVMHSGEVSTTIGLPGISSLAETIAVSQLIKLAESTGVHLHLAQISAADSVDQVREAKTRGLNVTCDVAIQNLLYTDEKVENFNSMYRCLPPLRAESDRQALLNGVKNGVIDTITSMHRPHEAAAKQAPFAETEAGMSSVELLMPMAKILHDSGDLSLDIFIDAMTRGSAKVLGIEMNDVSVGSVASLALLNENTVRTLSDNDLLSAGKNSPLLGQEVKSQVVATIVEGEIVYRI